MRKSIKYKIVTDKKCGIDFVFAENEQQAKTKAIELLHLNEEEIHSIYQVNDFNNLKLRI